MASVQDILTEKGSVVHTVPTSAMVYEAIESMVRHNVGALLAVSNDGLQGIITERDYMKRIAVCGKSSKNTAVAEIMTRDLVVVSPSTEVSTCMELMTGRRIRHLPVVHEGALVGVVSIGDIVKSKLREQDAQIRQMTCYIQGAPSASSFA
jgi:CBS domain-containing protein